jgi:hypothetical protein
LHHRLAPPLIGVIPLPCTCSAHGRQGSGGAKPLAPPQLRCSFQTLRFRLPVTVT